MLEMLGKYREVIVSGYRNYASYLLDEIFFNYDYKPWWENYLWMLVVISIFFFVLELIKPWNTKQPKFRKDFWLDVFYMFFNFFLFSLIFFNAAFDVFVNLFSDFLAILGVKNIITVHIQGWSRFAQLFTLFIVRDFIHWWIHRLLHTVPWLWNFHKVHHSVKQMGFAAHLRYHWMETIVYRAIEYIPLAMIGFGINDFFIVHVFTLTVGHWNHANIKVNIGPFKYLFNNPQMHKWHHAYDLPESKIKGVNFGITLSVWDYLFGTVYEPYEGQDIRIGFHGVESFPEDFSQQFIHGFKNR